MRLEFNACFLLVRWLLKWKQIKIKFKSCLVVQLLRSQSQNGMNAPIRDGCYDGIAQAMTLGYRLYRGIGNGPIEACHWWAHVSSMVHGGLTEVTDERKKICSSFQLTSHRAHVTCISFTYNRWLCQNKSWEPWGKCYIGLFILKMALKNSVFVSFTISRQKFEN